MAELETYNMKFANGDTIEVHPDGSGNWLSDEITAAHLTEKNLSHIEILQGETVIETREDQVCEGIYSYLNTKGFFLRDKTTEEKLREENAMLEDAILELAELIGGNNG